MKKESGKWIFVVDKLPTEVAPPAMSIHYAVPWPMDIKGTKKEKSFKKKASELRNILSECEYVDEDLLDETEDYDLWDLLNDEEVYTYVEECDEDLLSRDSNPYDNIERLKNAVQIKFAGENIRLFPEEFSVVSLQNMKEYVKVFKFHPTDLWNGLAVKPTDPDEKFIFEACLLDGCDEYQATNILNGGDIDSVDDFPAPLGWYECPKEYGLYFGKTEEDLTPRYRS